jgi:DNA primase
MGIVDDDVERVRAAASIVDIVGQEVQLRRVGRAWVGLCPFHPEKSPSFNVRESTGRYRCFGCGASGDVITFVRERQQLDFVGAVEHLAGKVGIQLTYTTGGEGRERSHRKELVDAMRKAVAWYHQRLLTGADAGPARKYLRSRGIDGDVVRAFQIGWAPDDWDLMARTGGVQADALRETGLAFTNKRNRLQDTFRARILFPIFTDAGDPVAFGGRILPGSADPAKYKNSPETPIYAKSKMLYGLNWAKADIVAADQVIVCEGYTDVIGFHRAGLPRAVATCGTALTEDHVRLLTRFAKRVVLAFDADNAGQAAADRFYEWEKKYDIAVQVLQMPSGKDPADVASTAPQLLHDAVRDAQPFLGFRVQRVLRAGKPTTPEARARTAELAMSVVNEHPDTNVRSIYAGQVAAHVGLPAADLVALAKRGGTKVRVAAPAERKRPRESAEIVALSLLLHRWDEIAELLIEPLFADDVNLAAFRALGEANGDLVKALEVAEPEARDLLERLAVSDIEAEPATEARNLVAAATRREIDRIVADRDFAASGQLGYAKQLAEQLHDEQSGPAAAEQLLSWLLRRNEERA